MADVTINRCTLRLVRHGGWSWGPDPRKLLKGAVDALPALLARELSSVWPDGTECQINAPIRIRVPLRMGELVAAAGLSNDVIQPSATNGSVSARIAEAVRTTFQHEQVASVANRESETHKREGLPKGDTETAEAPTPGCAVLHLLIEWRMNGLLETNLAAFSLPALEAWHSRLIAGDNDSLTGDASPQEGIDGPVHDIAIATRASLSVPPDTVDGPVSKIAGQDDSAARLRSRIVVLVEAARQKLQRVDPGLRTTGQETSPDSALLPLLLDWQSSGVLETQLGSFSPADLEAWHRRLISSEAGSTGRQTPASGNDREATLRRRIVALVEAAARLNRHSWDPVLLAALDREMPLSLSDASLEASRTERHRESFLSPPVPARSLRPRSSLRRGRLEKQCHVRSALPFLLLGPLSRSGYLKALAATLEAADCQADSPLFAAALAYKVLDPPQRGWRREQAAIDAASAFAALAESPAESELVDFARRISPHLSPLESALAGPLIASHDPRQPLLLHRTQSDRGDGLLLLDVQGIFPLSWANDANGLRRSLIRLESSAVLISEATAEPDLLNWMDREGFRFITDAAPTRGERRHALRRPPHERWWTNDGMTPESELVRMARAMETAANDAGTLWQSLAVERPSIPLADNPELDRHITLAASVALGTIAWALWRELESPAPHLALERFRDLDARVTFSRDAVSVSLPLGRRFQDLRDHRLANDVADVPWLGGRVLTFTSG